MAQKPHLTHLAPGLLARVFHALPHLTFLAKFANIITWGNSSAVQSAAFARRRSRVRVPVTPPP